MFERKRNKIPTKSSVLASTGSCASSLFFSLDSFGLLLVLAVFSFPLCFLVGFTPSGEKSRGTHGELVASANGVSGGAADEERTLGELGLAAG